MSTSAGERYALQRRPGVTVPRRDRNLTNEEQEVLFLSLSLLPSFSSAKRRTRMNDGDVRICIASIEQLCPDSIPEGGVASVHIDYGEAAPHALRRLEPFELTEAKPEWGLACGRRPNPVPDPRGVRCLPWVHERDVGSDLSRHLRVPSATECFDRIGHRRIDEERRVVLLERHEIILRRNRHDRLRGPELKQSETALRARDVRRGPATTDEVGGRVGGGDGEADVAISHHIQKVDEALPRLR